MEKNQYLTREQIAIFINQFDMLRGYHKSYEINDKLDFYLKHGSLVCSPEAKPINLSPDKIRQVIALFYSIPEISLTAKGRKGDILKHKQLFQYLLRSLTSMTLSQIGNYCGYNRKGSGHDTVLSNCKTIQNRVETEPNLMIEVVQIKDNLIKYNLNKNRTLIKKNI
jgi:hypothetical protein